MRLSVLICIILYSVIGRVTVCGAQPVSNTPATDGTDLKLQVEKLQKEHEVCSKEIKDLKNQIALKDISIDQITQKITNQNKSIRVARDSIKKGSDEKTSLQANLGSKNNEIADLNTELIAIKIELNNEKLAHLNTRGQAGNFKKELEEKGKALEDERIKNGKSLNERRNLNSKIGRLELESKDLAKKEIQQKRMNDELKKNTQSLKAKYDSMQLKHDALERDNTKLGKSASIYRWAIMGAIGLLTLSVIYPLIGLINRKKFTNRMHPMIEHETDPFMRDLLEQFFYLKKATELLRRTLFASIIITVSFIVVLISWNIFGTNALNLEMLIHENFWKMIGGISVPLGFVITIYGNAESKKNEISKILVDISKNTSKSK